MFRFPSLSFSRQSVGWLKKTDKVKAHKRNIDKLTNKNFQASLDYIFPAVTVICHRGNYHSKSCSKTSLWGVILIDVRDNWRSIWSVLNLGTPKKWVQAINQKCVFIFFKKLVRLLDEKRNILWRWPTKLQSKSFQFSQGQNDAVCKRSLQCNCLYFFSDWNIPSPAVILVKPGTLFVPPLRKTELYNMRHIFNN